VKGLGAAEPEFRRIRFRSGGEARVPPESVCCIGVALSKWPFLRMTSVSTSADQQKVGSNSPLHLTADLALWLLWLLLLHLTLLLLLLLLLLLGVLGLSLGLSIGLRLSLCLSLCLGLRLSLSLSLCLCLRLRLRLSLSLHLLLLLLLLLLGLLLLLLLLLSLGVRLGLSLRLRLRLLEHVLLLQHLLLDRRWRRAAICRNHSAPLVLLHCHSIPLDQALLFHISNTTPDDCC
jgi:hypothetical protein